jgi:hypothetical protein
VGNEVGGLLAVNARQDGAGKHALDGAALAADNRIDIGLEGNGTTLDKASVARRGSGERDA